MKILIVTQYFWPENFKINDLANGLSERGHQITVLTGKPNYPTGKFYKGYNLFNHRYEKINNIDIIRVPLLARGNSSSFKLILNYFSFAFFSSLASIFRVKGNYDLIFVFEPSPITIGIPAIVLKKKLKAPIFFWVLDLWPESAENGGNYINKFNIKILNSLVKFIYKHCDKIFISSRSFSSSIADKMIDSSKLVYFPNWAEESYLCPKIDKSKYEKLIPPGFIIMFAGNIGESQDFESVIKAVEQLRTYKEIQWIIIGDGRKKQWLMEEISIRKLDSSIKLLGSFQMSEMPNFFYHADALLVTLKKSKIFSLTVPAKIQTYLAFGKPILGMLDGEGAIIIKEAEAGLTCDAGDYIKLSENIKKMLLFNQSQRQKISEHAKKYYEEQFERRILLDRFEDEYKNFMSN
jgi:glycosyltransferase involved in cell wall biosynthesis